MQATKDLHPVHNYKDGLFNTASGIKVNLHYPKPEMIHILDIACGLSKICRFGGQVNTFYSVAQHSMLVAAMAPEHLKKEALLHDATEAYLGDVIKPLKEAIGEIYHNFESLFTAAISQHFNIDLEGTYDKIKVYDRMALELEHEALHKSNPGPLLAELQLHSLLLEDRWAWDHELARKLFMVDYFDLFNL